MATYFAIFALLLQVALIHCDEIIEPTTTEDVKTEPEVYEAVDTEPQAFHLDTPVDNFNVAEDNFNVAEDNFNVAEDNFNVAEDNFNIPEDNLNVVEDSTAGPKDFYDLFFGSQGSHSIGQSVQMMEEATKDSHLPADEQLIIIKDTADRITACIHDELVGVLKYICADNFKSTEESGNRRKRSTDSPVDYSKMVMRLLNHLKSSNECQNIAIEKMMTAQEIADKYGIDYQPEADSVQEIFDATENKNQDIIAFLTQNSKPEKEMNDSIPVADETDVKVESVDPKYYHYDVDEDVYEVTVPPQHMYPAPHCHYTLNPHCETQIRPPPIQHYNHQPVSQRPPVFYEPQPSFTPASHHHHHHHPHHEEEIPEIAAMIVETIEPEPELTGEEYEETVSSKVTVDKGDEPEIQEKEKKGKRIEKTDKKIKTDEIKSKNVCKSSTEEI